MAKDNVVSIVVCSFTSTQGTLPEMFTFRVTYVQHPDFLSQHVHFVIFV